jgi:hypothetical protein
MKMNSEREETWGEAFMAYAKHLSVGTAENHGNLKVISILVLIRTGHHLITIQKSYHLSQLVQCVCGAVCGGLCLERRYVTF